MQKILSITRTVITKTQNVKNLHRWGNHFNRNCIDRIDNCMSIRWNDYSSHSRNDKINENRTKYIDESYGHLFRINKNKKSQQTKKSIVDYNYKIHQKKDFENYFYLEMRASMMM